MEWYLRIKVEGAFYDRGFTEIVIFTALKPRAGDLPPVDRRFADWLAQTQRLEDGKVTIEAFMRGMHEDGLQIDWKQSTKVFYCDLRRPAKV